MRNIIISLLFLFLLGCFNNSFRESYNLDSEIILTANEENIKRYKLEKLQIRQRRLKEKETGQLKLREKERLESITEIERLNQIRLKEDLGKKISKKELSEFREKQRELELKTIERIESNKKYKIRKERLESIKEVERLRQIRLKEDIDNPKLARQRLLEEAREKEKKIAKEKRRKEHIKQLEAKELVEASSGSGFIVSKLGHIITNNHVINGCSDLKIFWQGKKYSGTILHKDKANDLALIKADFSPSVVFAINNKDAELIQDIYVAGYPFGNRISNSIKVTKGIVSSLSGIADNSSHIQIDAALQSGNSGGPIVDDKGNIVGVAVAKLDWTYMVKKFGQLPEDTNFAIKSSVLISFLNSVGLNIIEGNKENISKKVLANKLSKATILVSCFMTYAQIEQLKESKVMFEQFN